MRILMVCLGNICRSPMAEGILRARAEGTDIVVDSAGTSNYHIDENPDPRAVMTVRKHNLDISKLRGRQFSSQDFDDFDLIFAMDKSNLRHLLQLARNEEDRRKVHLIRNYTDPGMDLEVPDPYYGGEHGFEQVYQMLDAAAIEIVKRHG